MADIAFIALIFFLMVTTMDKEEGLRRRLPPLPAEDQKVEDQKVNRRNIIQVKINASDRLFAGNEPMDVSQLKDKIKEFLTNHALIHAKSQIHVLRHGIFFGKFDFIHTDRLIRLTFFYIRRN